jgi:hypothetical protein
LTRGFLDLLGEFSDGGTAKVRVYYVADQQIVLREKTVTTVFNREAGFYMSTDKDGNTTFASILDSNSVLIESGVAPNRLLTKLNNCR